VCSSGEGTDRNSCKRQQAAASEQATASRLIVDLVAASSTFDSAAAATTPLGSKQPVLLAAVCAVVGPPSLCVSTDAPGSKHNAGRHVAGRARPREITTASGRGYMIDHSSQQAQSHIQQEQQQSQRTVGSKQPRVWWRTPSSASSLCVSVDAHPAASTLPGGTSSPHALVLRVHEGWGRLRSLGARARCVYTCGSARARARDSDTRVCSRDRVALHRRSPVT
jgi:hypothetical protein